MVNVFKKIDIKPLRNRQPVDGRFKKLAEKDYDYLGVFGSTLKQRFISALSLQWSIFPPGYKLLSSSFRLKDRELR